jgi:hypothetical protein
LDGLKAVPFKSAVPFKAACYFRSFLTAFRAKGCTLNRGVCGKTPLGLMFLTAESDASHST